MKVRARNISLLEMNEFGQVTCVYRHYRDFGLQRELNYIR